MTSYILKIDEFTPEIMLTLQYLSVQPGVSIIAEDRKDITFQKAVAECNGVPVEVFFDELKSRIKQWASEHPDETGYRSEE